MEGIKNRLKQLPLFRGAFSLLDHWQMRRYFDKIGMTRLEERMRQMLPLSVQKGPFAGLRLLRRACGSVWVPKVLGCYETELAFAVEEIVRAGPDVIVDVGCAEGYFAVGFAHRASSAKVIAADTNPVALKMVREMAMLNKVRERIVTTGWITCSNLESHLSAARAPVVWCDIEGGEWELLNPREAPSLRKATIMVEDHEHRTGMPVAGLIDRFSPTHDHRLVDQVPRVASEWIPAGIRPDLNERETELAMAELRPTAQRWVYFKPRMG